MRKFIRWLISLFKKKSNLQPVSIPSDAIPAFQNKIIGLTAGKKHMWIQTKYGKVRKPVGWV